MTPCYYKKSEMKLSKFFSLMSLWSINMAPKVYKNHPQKALVPMITQLCSNTDSKHKWRCEFHLPHSKKSERQCPLANLVLQPCHQARDEMWVQVPVIAVFLFIINRTSLLLGLVVLYDEVSYLHYKYITLEETRT